MIKVVCIKEPITGLIFSKPKVGNTYYMSLRENFDSDNSDNGYVIIRKTVGHYIYEKENSPISITIEPESYNECFITFDEWREQKINTILDGYQD